MADAGEVTVEGALAEVQRLFRMETPEDPGGRGETRALATDDGHDESIALRLTRAESQALRTAERALAHDLRFEHLEDHTRDAVWRFASGCYLEREVDHVPAFIAEQGRPLLHETCYIPVEYMEVSQEVEVLGLRLLPLDDPRVPSPNRAYQVVPEAKCIAAIATTGTSRSAMTDRAREQLEYRLRLLRIALREHMGINNRQLRFRASEVYSYGEDFSGWQDRGERGFPLELDPSLIELAEMQPVAELIAGPQTELERRVDVAMRWMERARFTIDPLVALLYLFFAMEALLGSSKSDKIALRLAFRQTMLAAAVGKPFTHPNETFFLYTEVRNAAVHGDAPPAVSWDTVRGFELTVRWTLKHYINLAREQRFTTRAELLEWLGTHGDRQQVIEWLRINGGPKWNEYLDKMEGKVTALGSPAGQR